MKATGRPPQRVRVTSPRMTATPRSLPLSARREINEQTGVGEVYVRSLVRALLRLGLTVIVVLGLTVGSLPLLFTLDPHLSGVRLLTVPLPWLLIGGCVYPLLIGLAWWHLRAADRAESDFFEIVERR